MINSPLSEWTSSSDNKDREYWKRSVSSAVQASFIAKTIISPIESVQYTLESQFARTNKIKNIQEAISSLSRTGPLTFWRGHIFNLFRYCPTQVVNFGIFHLLHNGLKEELQNNEDLTSKQKKIIELQSVFILGALPSLITYPFTYPLEVARIRMLTDESLPRLKFNQLVSNMVKNEGFSSLYRGFRTSFFGSLLYRGLYFGSYTASKHFYFQDKKEETNLERFALAYASTLFSQTVAYPYNPIRHTLMASGNRNFTNKIHAYNEIIKKTEDPLEKLKANEAKNMNQAENKRRGLLTRRQCFRVLKDNGLLFKGFPLSIVRAMGGAICLVLYDIFMEKTSSEKHNL